MKKTIAALAAITVLSLGAAFAQEPAKTETKVENKTSTNPVTGSTTEKKTETSETKTADGGHKKSTKKHKKTTKKTGETKSETTKTETKSEAPADKK